MNPDLLLTQSLRAAPWGAAVSRILAAALDAVEPAAAVRRFLRRQGDQLYAGERVYDLARYERVFLVGAGKAGAPMARAVAEVVGDRLAGGVVVVKEGYLGSEIRDWRLEIDDANLQSLISNLDLIEAGHPLPDQRGVEGAGRIAALLAQASERDLVIAVISGGGSALLTLPANGVSLADLQGLTAALLRCGASIDEINTLRKHLDQVKGGGLAGMVHPAALVTLVLSDVVGDRLDVIASGPTVPDPTTFAEAYAIIERYGILAAAPRSVVEQLRRGMAGAVAETPKPGDARFERVQNLIVGSNQQAAEGALAAAQAEGFNTLLLTTYPHVQHPDRSSLPRIETVPPSAALDDYLALLKPPFQGEARLVGHLLALVARQLATTGAPRPRPACLIAGGETTVTLRGEGAGGRNQELALAAAADLAGLPDLALVALATDGGDGPTDAAGAVATDATLERARQLGLDPAAYLARNDSYRFFAALGDLLRPGPTQTNVNDLAFIFAF